MKKGKPKYDSPESIFLEGIMPIAAM